MFQYMFQEKDNDIDLSVTWKLIAYMYVIRVHDVPFEV